MGSDRMGCRQLQNELPTFAFLVNQGLLNCKSQIKIIKLLFSSYNKTNPISQHILLKRKERRCTSLAMPYKPDSAVVIRHAFESKGTGFEPQPKKEWPNYLTPLMESPHHKMWTVISIL